MKQWTSDDFRPPHKLLRPQVLTSPEMATPQKQLRPERSEEQAANLQVLQGFFDACGFAAGHGWRVERRIRKSGQYRGAIDTPQGWHVASLKKLGEKLGLDADLVAQHTKACKAQWHSSLQKQALEETWANSQKQTREGQPRRQPKNRPTPISPVAKKRGRSISSTLDDFKACPQPQDVLMQVVCKGKEGILNRHKKHILCRCPDCQSADQTRCIFTGTAFVRHSGLTIDAASKWTEEVYVVEVDAGPCYLTLAAQLQSLFRSGKIHKRARLEHPNSQPALPMPGSGMPMSQADAGPQKEWPSNGPLVSACNKAPAPEPDAAPEPAEAGRLASAHASRSNSQDWGCSPHPSPASTDRLHNDQPSSSNAMDVPSVPAGHSHKRKGTDRMSAEEEHDLRSENAALKASAREKDETISKLAAKLGELDANLRWANKAPERMMSLLDRRDETIKELEELAESLKDQIQRMKHP
ncbi:hypothetical protein WJX84_002634 [Apatococcus fuscideae]|uniref:Uncharacterized protein n=1 Tax=Apatococcus fuscideae TaxID=2026836 RepID=A0AAW1T3Z6_9CHLO